MINGSHEGSLSSPLPDPLSDQAMSAVFLTWWANTLVELFFIMLYICLVAFIGGRVFTTYT